VTVCTIVQQRHFIVLIAIALVPVWAGCESKSSSDVVFLKGKVTNAGQPLEVKSRATGTGMVRIAFHPIKDGKAAAVEVDATSANEAGDFHFRDGIPPGEYRVVIEQWDPYPQVDKLNGKFSLDRSPIVKTVSHDVDYVEIDISDPTRKSK